MINILATNDDGIEAPGLAALAAACADLGAVFVVAPMENKSGASSSLTLHSAVRVRRFSEKSIRRRRDSDRLRPSRAHGRFFARAPRTSLFPA